MITKQIVLQYEGKIWVESKEGVGSEFIFKLQIIEVDAEVEAEAEEDEQIV